MRRTINKISNLSLALILGLGLSACTNVADHALSNDMLYTASYSSPAGNAGHVSNYPDLVNWQE